MKAIKSSRRFDSLANAIAFSKNVNGTIKDLRNYIGSKSNFKVIYLKADAKAWGKKELLITKTT
jgi:hypothetical protein